MVILIDDRPLLRPVIENLIQNLGKRTGEGGVIEKGERITDAGNKTVQKYRSEIAT
jgi:hypothetical protein